MLDIFADRVVFIEVAYNKLSSMLILTFTDTIPLAKLEYASDGRIMDVFCEKQGYEDSFHTLAVALRPHLHAMAELGNLRVALTDKSLAAFTGIDFETSVLRARMIGSEFDKMSNCDNLMNLLISFFVLEN